MAFQVISNSPTVGSIQWLDLHIVYKGFDYAIVDGHTDKRFIWWAPAISGTVLQTSDDFPELGEDDLLVFLNKDGVAITVPTSTVIDGSLIVPESILADAIAANAIASHHILAGEILAHHIGAGEILAGHILAGEIGSAHIGANQILANHILAGEILAHHIAAEQIQGNHIEALAIASNHIGANQILANHIKAGSITTNHLAFQAAERDKIIAQINASPESGSLKIAANRIEITGQTTFAAGYDPTTKETPAGAQQKATAAQNAAIAAAATDATNKANAAEQAAKSHADTKAAAAEANAKAYADGKVAAVETNVTIRATTAPTQRPGGGALKNGDIWLKSNEGDLPHVRSGSSWVRMYTTIDGGNIKTGTIDAARIKIGSASTFDSGYDPSTKETPSGAQAKAAAAEAAAKAASLAKADYLTSGTTTIDGGKITAGSIKADQIASNAVTAAKIQAGAVTANKIKAGEITTNHLAFQAAEKDKIIAQINASPESGSLKIAANRIQISGQTTFASGYDPSTKETPAGAQQKATAAQNAAIAAAATDATNKANAAEQAAKSHADTKAAAAESAAKAHADSKAAAAEAAAKAASLAKADYLTSGTTTIDGGKITADSIKAAQIGAGVIGTQHLAVGSAPLPLNNPTITGTLDGWETTQTSIATDAVRDGVPVRTLRITTDGNRQIRTRFFEIDPSRTYEVRLSLHARDAFGNGSSGGSLGRAFFGLYAYNETGTNIGVTPFYVSSRSFGEPTTNGYFFTGAPMAEGEWRDMVAYILAHDVSADEVPVGKNVSNHFRLPPDATHVRIRVLNYYNGGVTRRLDIYSPVITPVDVTMIHGDSIVTGSIEANRIRAGSITTDRLAFQAAEKDKIIAQINASPESGSLKIAANRIQISGQTTFAAGYDPSTKETPSGAQAKAAAAEAAAKAASLAKADYLTSGTTTIDGGKITAGSIKADQIASNAVTAAKIQAGAVTANKINVDNLAAIKADMGTITAGKIQSTDQKFTIDASGQLVTIQDRQGTPRTRVRLGKLGSGTADYGIEIRDQSNNLILGATGLGTQVIGREQMKSGIRPVEVLSSLPSAGDAGRLVLLVPQGVLYRDTGSDWQVATAVDFGTHNLLPYNPKIVGETSATPTKNTIVFEGPIEAVGLKPGDIYVFSVEGYATGGGRVEGTIRWTTPSGYQYPHTALHYGNEWQRVDSGRRVVPAGATHIRVYGENREATGTAYFRRWMLNRGPVALPYEDPPWRPGENPALPPGTTIQTSSVIFKHVAHGIWEGEAQESTTAIKFPQQYAKEPKIFFTGGGLTYDPSITVAHGPHINALNVTPQSFILEAKLRGASGTPTNRSRNFSQVGGSPPWQVSKSNSAQAFDKRYTFYYDLELNSFILGGVLHWSEAEVTCWYNSGSGWSAAGSVMYRNDTGSLVQWTNLYQTYSIEGLGSSATFGLSVTYAGNAPGGHSFTGKKVEWVEMGSIQEKTATPNGASKVRFLVVGAD